MKFEHYISKKEINDYLNKNPNLNHDKFKSNIEKLNQKYIQKYLNHEIFQLSEEIKLDFHQQKCILTDEEAVLLIAGAGSGKTTTIQGKIRYLLEIKKIPANQILCISFTRKAAFQLQEKLLKFSPEIQIATFHSLGLKIIKSFEYKNVKIVSENYLENLIKEELLLQKVKESIYYQKNLFQFLKKLKINNYSILDLKKWLDEVNDKKQHQFYSLALTIYQKYQNYLLENNLIDFDDMIIKATNLLKNNFYHEYQYIIIDEYQDISYARYLLIREIKQQTKAKLLAVGDDWQAIYGFSGSCIDLFTNFSKYFEDAKIMYLVATYRNSQQLLNITTNFILKNPFQIAKELQSPKLENNPIVLKRYLSLTKTFKKVISNINGPVLVLGRNNKDINLLKDSEIEINHNGLIKYHQYQANFLTVHKAKGLESENVIIINMKNDLLGFPSQIEEPFFIKKMIKSEEKYKYAEERRLFYVALTRTKNKVYILVPYFKKSVFAKELKKIISMEKIRKY